MVEELVRDYRQRGILADERFVLEARPTTLPCTSVTGPSAALDADAPTPHGISTPGKRARGSPGPSDVERNTPSNGSSSHKRRAFGTWRTWPEELHWGRLNADQVVASREPGPSYSNGTTRRKASYPNSTTYSIVLDDLTPYAQAIQEDVSSSFELRILAAELRSILRSERNDEYLIRKTILERLDIGEDILEALERRIVEVMAAEGIPVGNGNKA